MLLQHLLRAIYTVDYIVENTGTKQVGVTFALHVLLKPDSLPSE